MGRGKHKRGSSVLWVVSSAALVVGLGALNWHLLYRPIDASALSPQTIDSFTRAPGDSEASSGGPRAAAVHQYPETLARPLFFSDRRSPEPEKAVKTQPKKKKKTRTAQALPPGLKLVGIVEQLDRGSRLALFRSKAMPNGTWLEEGGEFEGWRISKVGHSSVIIQTGRQSQEVMLFPPQADAGKRDLTADE